jgi:hypothetical protein
MALQPNLTIPIFYRCKFIDSAFNNQTFSGSDPPPFNLTLGARFYSAYGDKHSNGHVVLIEFTGYSRSIKIS